MLKKKQKQKKPEPDRIKRASSELSYFATQEPLESVLDKIWHSMTYNEQIESLLAYHDDKDRNLFILAVRAKDYELIELLLSNKQIDVNEQDIYGNTALHHAVLMKDTESLLRLLNSERIITTRANKDRRTVREMLEDLEDTETFSDSVYKYCYSRLPYSFRYT